MIKMIKVTKFVREKRQERKESQTQFAKHCHVSQSTISNVENDLPITEEYAEKIAKAFNLSLKEIADEPERVELVELALTQPIDEIRDMLRVRRKEK
jgi:transcriptional regulator with XRE-family HTH domain